MRLATAALAALALASPATAADCQGRLSHLENEIMCPVCPAETIAQTDAAIAQRIKATIVTRCQAGQSDGQIKSYLVSQFGERILAAPPKRGFNLLAWLAPLAGILLAALAVATFAWRRKQLPESSPPRSGSRHPELDPELERRLDAELERFDA